MARPILVAGQCGKGDRSCSYTFYVEVDLMIFPPVGVSDVSVAIWQIEAENAAFVCTWECNKSVLMTI